MTAPNGSSFFAPADRFSAQPAPPELVATYAQHWGWVGLPYVVAGLPSQRLAQRAWEALEGRDAELATRLARVALDQRGDKGFARTTLATIHIINQAYGEISEVPAPTQEDALNKAWGETLSGDAGAALDAFGAASAPDDSVIGIYLRNITALAHFRQGDAARAWELQHEIRYLIAAMDPPSPHLASINALNMSRLARAERDCERAQGLLEAAFDARASNLSEHDALYFAVLRAGVSSTPSAAAECWAEAARVF